jgi:hypothetical protein
MKENNYFYKPRYEGYLKLICKYLTDDMHTKLTRKRILYEEITYAYGNVFVIVV